VKKITDIQAFEVMKHYLEGYAYRTQSEEIKSLLSELQWSDGGSTMDPAAWVDWRESVSAITNQEHT